jgi:predicted nucleic acid-binding protein
MRYVLDSSVALKTVLPEPDSNQALNFIDAGHTLIAPDIYTMELAHVLSKLHRQHVLPEDEVREKLEVLFDARPALKLSTRLLPAAWEISLQTRCSVWDALYVALAEREGIEMVTADERLVKNLNRPDVVLLKNCR